MQIAAADLDTDGLDLAMGGKTGLFPFENLSTRSAVSFFLSCDSHLLAGRRRGLGLYRHRLFIARQNRVMVVDGDKGTLLGEIPGIQGAHGTAIAATSGHGFATSGNDHSVVMFDLKTLNVLGRIPAAEDADAILYDKPSNRVFTLNADAHSSTVIDAKTGKLVTNIPLGGKPVRRIRGRRQVVLTPLIIDCSADAVLALWPSRTIMPAT